MDVKSFRLVLDYVCVKVFYYDFTKSLYQIKSAKFNSVKVVFVFITCYVISFVGTTSSSVSINCWTTTNTLLIAVISILTVLKS